MAQQNKKRKVATRSHANVVLGDLETQRVHRAAREDEQARIKRLDLLRGNSTNKSLITSKVKIPVTLRRVYDVFIQRIEAEPVKVMRSEEPDPFTRTPRVLKIEARFIDLTMRQVLSAMAGLEVRKELAQMKDMSYSHIAQWGYAGKSFKFRVSMYRYKDRSCLFIFTPE